MRKPYHNLSLAKSPSDWEQLDADVTRLVDELCGHGDYDSATKLFTLLDLATNEKYDALDRSSVCRIARNRAFTMTEAFEAAVEAEIQKHNPIALRKTG
jgi:hypothetical protein